MKTSYFLAKINYLLVLSLALAMVMPLGQVQASPARDAAVDAALLSDSSGSGRILPPTGNPSVMATALPAAPPAFLPVKHPVTGFTIPEQSDKEGRVYDISGKVRIANKNGDGWHELTVGTMIQNGNVILTGKDSYASVTFDERYMNAVHIPENTRAFFKSIEPTDIQLQDGTLFNILDGLPPGGSWQVATPVAVAAVRGTWYFVSYAASSGDVVSGTFNVPDDGKESYVHLGEILKNGQSGSSVDIPEGNQIHLKAGQLPDPSLLEKIDKKWLRQIEDFLKKLMELRKKGTTNRNPADNDFEEGGPGSDFDPLLDGDSLPDEQSSDEEPPRDDSSSRNSLNDGFFF